MPEEQHRLAAACAALALLGLALLAHSARSFQPRSATVAELEAAPEGEYLLVDALASKVGNGLWAWAELCDCCTCVRASAPASVLAALEGGRRRVLATCAVRNVEGESRLVLLGIKQE